VTESPTTAWLTCLGRWVTADWSFGHANDWLSFIPWNEKNKNPDATKYSNYYGLWTQLSTLFTQQISRKKLAHVIKLNCKFLQAGFQGEDRRICPYPMLLQNSSKKKATTDHAGEDTRHTPVDSFCSRN
jgi:hypothetical protein